MKYNWDKIYYKKPFILVVSCKSYANRINIIKSMWLNHCKIPYKILIGDKNLEKEAKRIIDKLPRMTPGRQRGRPVRVPFSIPITFRLQ